MFARNVALRLRPNSLSQFTQIFEKEVLPALRKQAGFRDEIVFATRGSVDVIAISLWDTKEHAEAYDTAAYPQVVKSLNPVLDGSPKVRAADMIISTIHKEAAVLVA